MDDVILQFSTFEARERWLEQQPHNVTRVYRDNPWVAAQLPKTERDELAADPEVEVFSDVRMTPMAF